MGRTFNFCIVQSLSYISIYVFERSNPIMVVRCCVYASFFTMSFIVIDGAISLIIDVGRQHSGVVMRHLSEFIAEFQAINVLRILY